MFVLNYNLKSFSKCALLFVSCLALCFPAFCALAEDDEPEAMRRWVRTTEARDKDGDQDLKIKVTYYSNEYIEAMVKRETEKNLWTQDEVENYKYTLLKMLNLNEYIAFHLDIRVYGIPMYPSPLDKHIWLMIGNKRYTPSDYDKRFNFKIIGERDGMVYFPRYDPKTGKNLLEGAKDIRLVFDKSITKAVVNRSDIVWIWDISKDKPEAFVEQGKAANRLEIDRLLKRLDKLGGERQELQKKLDELDSELNRINSRIDELQAR